LGEKGDAGIEEEGEAAQDTDDQEEDNHVVPFFESFRWLFVFHIGFCFCLFLVVYGLMPR
jgi:hypothetical protein